MGLIASGGLAEGVGLVACGDLSNGSNCVLIPPECFKTAYGGLAEGVGFEPTVGLTQRSISSRVP